MRPKAGWWRQPIRRFVHWLTYEEWWLHRIMDDGSSVVIGCYPNVLDCMMASNADVQLIHDLPGTHMFTYGDLEVVRWRWQRARYTPLDPASRVLGMQMGGGLSMTVEGDEDD